MERLALYLPLLPQPPLFLHVLFSNHIIFILKVNDGSTDHLSYLPIHKTHQSVLKYNPFFMANQLIKQPTKTKRTISV
jgi:hypothetical protein